MYTSLYIHTHIYIYIYTYIISLSLYISISISLSLYIYVYIYIYIHINIETCMYLSRPHATFRPARGWRGPWRAARSTSGTRGRRLGLLLIIRLLLLAVMIIPTNVVIIVMIVITVNSNTRIDHIVNLGFPRSPGGGETAAQHFIYGF